jgi:pimeloyl-ACP methyl ester carboxylesterase
MKKNLFCIILLLVMFYLSSCNNSDTGKTTPNENPATPEVKSIFINGDSIHYIDIGKGDPVVFVHGAVGDYRTWGAQMDTFSKNHRVIAYSRRFAFPNKQMIDDSAHLTVASHANDLYEFLKAMNVGKAHIVGHSFGANTALLTAIDHPELVHSLTLGEAIVPSLVVNAPGGDTVMNNFITTTFIPTGEAFKNNNNEKAVIALINGVTGDSMYSSRLPQRDRDIMMANLAELKGILARQDIFTPVTCDDIKKINVPVLLLKGDKSPLVFSLTINELNRCLSNKEIATLANTSHGLEYENPDGFNKTVLGFIDKHSRD